MTKITALQNFFAKQYTNIQSSQAYKKLQEMPKFKRWAVIGGFFIASQIIVFGALYVFFGKVAVIGFLASILAGLATGLGALPAAFFKSISDRLFNSLLGAAAGVMLAATAFSLLVPGLEYGNQLWPGKGLWVVSCGMLIGAIFLHFADQRLPHIRFDSATETQFESYQKIWLFITAITIHNFPEGLSVGVSFGSGDMKNAMGAKVGWIL